MTEISRNVVHTTPPVKKPRVAILVDGENVSQAMAGQIIMKSRLLGDLVIRRVYGNAIKLPAWDVAPGFRIVHSGTGKNSTDLLLSVEAMALMLTGQADILVIAASDRDYTHVAMHLREAGYTVIGLGEEKAPEAFRKSCSNFFDLTALSVAPLASTMPSQPTVKRPETLEEKVSAVIAQSGSNGMVITTLNVQMHRLHSVKISLEPEKTWRKYLEARPKVFRCEPQGSDARVRIL